MILEMGMIYRLCVFPTPINKPFLSNFQFKNKGYTLAEGSDRYRRVRYDVLLYLQLSKNRGHRPTDRRIKPVIEIGGPI